MSPEVALATRIEEALPDDADRIHMLVAPQDPVIPVAVLQLISNVSQYHARGENRSQFARVQLKVYAGRHSGADAYRDADAFAERIHGDGAGSCLSGFRGQVGGSPGGLFIESIQAIEKRGLYEPDELQLVGIVRDYFVYYRGL